MTKTIHFRWENRFVLQYYGAVRKLYPSPSLQTAHFLSKLSSTEKNLPLICYDSISGHKDVYNSAFYSCMLGCQAFQQE